MKQISLFLLSLCSSHAFAQQHDELASIEASIAAPQVACDKYPVDQKFRELCDTFCSTTYYIGNSGHLAWHSNADNIRTAYLAQLFQDSLEIRSNNRDDFFQEKMRADRASLQKQISQLKTEISALEPKSSEKELKRKAADYLHPENWESSQIPQQKVIYKIYQLGQAERQLKMLYPHTLNRAHLTLKKLQQDTEYDANQRLKHTAQLKFKGQNLRVSFYAKPGATTEAPFVSHIEVMNGSSTHLLCKTRPLPSSAWNVQAQEATPWSEIEFFYAIDQVCEDLRKLSLGDPFEFKQIRSLAQRYQAILKHHPAGSEEFIQERLANNQSPRSLFSYCTTDLGLGLLHPLHAILQQHLSNEQIRELLELGVDPGIEMGDRTTFFSQALFLLRKQIKAGKTDASASARLLDLFLSKGLYESPSFKSSRQTPLGAYLLSSNGDESAPLAAADYPAINKLIAYDKQYSLEKSDSLMIAVGLKRADIFEYLLNKGLPVENKAGPNPLDNLIERVALERSLFGDTTEDDNAKKYSPYIQALIRRGAKPKDAAEIPQSLKHLFPNR